MLYLERFCTPEKHQKVKVGKLAERSAELLGKNRILQEVSPRALTNITNIPVIYRIESAMDLIALEEVLIRGSRSLVWVL